MKTHFRGKLRCIRICSLAILMLFSTSLLSVEARDKVTVSIEKTNTSLVEVFNQVEASSNYLFSYNPAILAGLKVSDSIQFEGNIKDFLDQVLSGSNITYVVKENEILLQSAKPKTTQQKQSNRRTIKGTVISSEDNQPIIGANIWIKNSATGAITDMDGRYSISTSEVGGVLTFSYVGMKSQEIVIGDKTTIDVILHPDSEILDEVVVVGYGSQKKESVVGAISSVDVKNLNIPGVSALSNALAGQLSGVVSMTRSGEPGKPGAGDFYIRGVSSFKGNTQPLVLVDGIERSLDLVDSEDIETFSILKDASASAVYGVRGANGVIIITTKKGEAGKPKINVRAEGGITSPTKMPKFANSHQWAELYNEALGRAYYDDETIQNYINGNDPDLYPNVDWIKELYKGHAFNKRVSFNLNGGGDIATYYISGSYYNENSIFKNAGDRYDYNSSINYDKYNFRANINFKLTPSTDLNLNIANIYEKSFAPGADKGDIWDYAFNTSPNAYPKEYSDGTLSAPSTASGSNPWNLLVHSGYREQFWNSAQSLIGLTQDFGKLWKPLSGLTGNLKFSWDAWNTALQNRTKTPDQYHATGRDDEGNLIFGDPIYTGSQELSYERTSDGTMTTYLEASLNYNKLFLEEHRVGGLFLYNHKIHRRTHDGDKFRSLPYKNQGIAARVTYAFRDTYFAEFNMGYNGSENFAKGHRFGFFPAFAAGWLISNEKWFEPLTGVIDMLKIKGSHGIVGNDDIGGSRRWIYEPTIVGGKGWNYGSTGQQGGSSIRIGDIENLSVSWEEAKKTNIGIELSFFRKLKIQADYFREKRTGIFLQRAALPNIVGLSTTPYVNIGETQNKGIDASLEYTQNFGDLVLTARGSFTYNRNEVLENDEPDWLNKYQNKIGKPFGKGGQYQPFGLKALGLFESQEEIDNSPTQTFGEYRVGDIKYQDINGDGVIDSKDMVAIGYTNLPEVTYGFGFNLQYKGFDANVLFQGVARTSFFTGGAAMTPFSTGNLERSAINRDIYYHVWKSTNTLEENRRAKYPRLSEGGGPGASNNNRNSTFNLQNGNFMRLKNLEIGYSLPKKILSKTFINSLRFYIAGSNLFTISSFKLWDPETQSSSGGSYPPNRIVTLGFSINL